MPDPNRWCLASLCLALWLGMPWPADAGGKPRLPRGVEAALRADGAYALSVKVSAPPPGGDRVLRLDTRTPLDTAIARLCPHGHDLQKEDPARLSVDAGGRFAAVAHAIVRCRPPSGTDPAAAGADAGTSGAGAEPVRVPPPREGNPR